MAFLDDDVELDFGEKIISNRRFAKELGVLNRNAKPPADHLVLKAQEHGGKFLHIISSDLHLNSIFARCIACGKALKVVNFDADRNAEGLATRRNFVLEATCRDCKQRELETAVADHPDYRPELDEYWRKHYVSLCANANTRRILVSITKDEILERYLSNGGKCEVTGVLLKPEKGKSNRFAPSVDRVDSSGSYEAGNIQIVARAVNMMKGTMSTDEFYEWCDLVAKRD
jgi:hypothetical protein